MTTLVCIGLATSGLSPERDALLEVGAYAMDRHTLAFVGERKRTFKADVAAILPAVDEKVYSMHDANGLWLDVAQSICDGQSVDNDLAGWLDTVGAAGSPKSPLICFGSEWTRSWLLVHLPKTLGRFARDQIDMGVLLRANNCERPDTNGRAIVTAQTVAQCFRELFGPFQSSGKRATMIK